MKGRLTLSLRNPSDVVDYLQAKDLESVNFQDIEKKIPEYNSIRQRSVIGNR